VCRTVSFRRHLLGVVREADVARVLGTLERTYGEELREGDRFVRDGRARVRDLIVSERKQRGAENARMPAQTVARVTRKPRRCLTISRSYSALAGPVPRGACAKL